MSKSPRNPHVGILTPKVIVLGGGTLGRWWLGHEGGVLMSGIRGPRRDLTVPLSAPQHVRAQQEVTSLWPGGESSPEPGPAGTLILDSWSPDL